MKLRPMSIATALVAALLLGAMLGTDASAPPQAATGSEPTRAMVLTFDDLPYASGGQLHQFAVHLAAAHLAHLKHHESSLAASELPTFRLAVSMAIGQQNRDAARGPDRRGPMPLIQLEGL